MPKLELTLACGDYDRTRPLWDGSVRPEGIDLNVLLLPVEEIFLRMVRYQEFEVSELSLSSFLMTRGKVQPGFIALPAFPSRKFRHGDIYIRRDSPIRKPQDLRGGRIGLPEYQMTAAVWIRGILQEHYGVQAEEIRWYAAHDERFPIDLPSSIRLEKISKNATLVELLRRGELDAIFTARVPQPFLDGEDWIARLFPNCKESEIDYFRKTGIFPIMHTVVIRRDIYEKYPWAAQSIFRAFCQAKARALQQSLGLGAPPVTLPWFFQEMDDTIQLMGKDFWPYGLTPNLKPLQKLIEYMGQQGLLGDDKSVAVGDLFAPNIF